MRSGEDARCVDRVCSVLVWIGALVVSLVWLTLESPVVWIVSLIE